MRSISFIYYSRDRFSGQWKATVASCEPADYNVILSCHWQLTFKAKISYGYFQFFKVVHQNTIMAQTKIPVKITLKQGYCKV